MDSQLLLYIFIGIGLFFAALFLSAKTRPKKPTRLNVKAGEKFQKDVSDQLAKPQTHGSNGLSSPSHLALVKNTSREAEILEPLSKAEQSVGKTKVELQLELHESKLDVEASTQPAAKNLSIFFMYNGHDWEAHDVLGIPQGASLVMATEMYQKLIKTEDPSTFEFYESAYNAILQKRKKERL